jgi:hypothetical protein
MLIIIEYTQGETTDRICYDVTGHSKSEIIELLPTWLKEDGINADCFRIAECLTSVMTKTK